MTKLRELSEKPDGWGDIRVIEPADARAILAALPSDTTQAPVMLTDEQRAAIERAAGRAHVVALGKPIDGVEGQRWRVLSDLFRAAPVAPAAAAGAERFDLRFPAVLRKMWSGCEVQAWLDELPPLYEVPTQARDGNTGNASLIGGAPVELVQFIPAQAAGRAGLATPARLSTDAVAQLSTETVDKPVQRMSDAERNVLAERARQVSVEGWTPTHDDQNGPREMPSAAAAYALSAAGRRGDGAEVWPQSWAYEWWKPTTPRRDLVKAGELIIAEIERIDRAGYEEA